VLAESQERGLAGGGGGGGAAAVLAQPILDLRGPTARVITDMEQLGKGTGDAAAADDTPMPELQHNLALLVSCTLVAAVGSGFGFCWLVGREVDWARGLDRLLIPGLLINSPPKPHPQTHHSPRSP